jgi:hypothetical protein
MESIHTSVRTSRNQRRAYKKETVIRITKPARKSIPYRGFTSLLILLLLDVAEDVISFYQSFIPFTCSDDD